MSSSSLLPAMLGCRPLCQISSSTPRLGPQCSMRRSLARAAAVGRPLALRCRAGSGSGGPAPVPVRFKLQQAVEYGESLTLVGSHPALGKWKVSGWGHRCCTPDCCCTPSH